MTRRSLQLRRVRRSWAHLDWGEPSLTVVARCIWHGCGTRQMVWPRTDGQSAQKRVMLFCSIKVVTCELTSASTFRAANLPRIHRKTPFRGEAGSHRRGHLPLGAGTRGRGEVRSAGQPTTRRGCGHGGCCTSLPGSLSVACASLLGHGRTWSACGHPSLGLARHARFGMRRGRAPDGARVPDGFRRNQPVHARR
jgi:hypothetical protein